MYNETHPNPNEIFPYKGKRSKPGGFAKKAARTVSNSNVIIGLVLTVATAIATIMVLTFLSPAPRCILHLRMQTSR